MGRCEPRNVLAMLARNIVLGRFAICCGKIRAATCRKIHFSVIPRSLYSGANPRAERNDVFVEIRVPRFDRRIHRDAVSL